VVDGLSNGTVSEYTFGNVMANHTIAASFAITTFNITSSASAGGTIAPDGVTTVNYGANQTYTMTANAGKTLIDVMVDGASVGAVPTYTFTNITADHTIAASFVTTSYTITATAGAGGNITPSGAVQVYEGTDQMFTISPDSGYHVTHVYVDGVSQGSITTYTFTNVTAAHNIAAAFGVNPVITATAGSGGTITPSGAVSVDYGTNQTFAITPNAGYHITDVLVDGASQGAVSSYTFTNVVADHTISATYAINTYTLTPSAGAHGSISPSGVQTVNYGGSQAFTMTPESGYVVAEVLVDGVSVGAVTSYTFTNVQASHTIAVSFTPITYTITATAGAGGTITPSGAVSVDEGANQAFAIAGSTGYHIVDVVVDGGSVGPVTSYTFTNVVADHSISATFAINTYTLTPSASAGGSISPSSPVTVNYGGSQTFTMSKNPGYYIADVLVDGVSVGAVTSYTFSNVQASHTIYASFAANQRNMIFYDGFETDTRSTYTRVNGGNIAWSTTNPKNGTHIIRERNVASMAKTISTSGYSDVVVQFAWNSVMNQASDYAYFQYSLDGSSYTTFWSQYGPTTSQSSLSTVTTTMPTGASNNPNFRIRFGIAANANTDYFYVDDIIITAIAI
ncbi:MAG: hypothetical protein GYA23_12860, partial [Methanomicrobiales archaeon]|nr:hypothetical protein [Methanomicrobiales archaeon]